MTINFADAGARTDWLADRPDAELPDLADVIDINSRRDPNRRVCKGAWVLHDRDEWLACPFCGGAA